MHGRPFFASRASGPQNVKKGGRGDDASDSSKDQCQAVAFPAFLFDVAAHHDNTVMRHGRHASARMHMPGAASALHAHPVECAVADCRDTSLRRLRLRRQVRGQRCESLRSREGPETINVSSYVTATLNHQMIFIQITFLSFCWNLKVGLSREKNCPDKESTHGLYCSPGRSHVSAFPEQQTAAPMAVELAMRRCAMRQTVIGPGAWEDKFTPEQIKLRSKSACKRGGFGNCDPKC